jgi:hypothetical protein
MNTTAPSSPTKAGGAKVDPATSKRIIRFVENLQQNDKEFLIFKNKLKERFAESKRPRNKLPALTTSFDATKIQQISSPLSGGRASSTRQSGGGALTKSAARYGATEVSSPLSLGTGPFHEGRQYYDKFIHERNQSYF